MNATAHLSIGGLHVALNGGDTLRLALGLPGMALFRCPEAGTAQVEVLLDAPAPTDGCRWLSDFDVADGSQHCRFGVDNDGMLHYLFSHGGSVSHHPTRGGAVRMGSFADPAVLRYALWLAYGMAALRHGAVPVHSSAVVAHGGAVLCLGESGTGKSTHTRLWLQHLEGCWLLNDDSPVVRIEADGVWAYGSPWSGKTPCFHTERVPLHALVRLSQAPANAIERLRTVPALAALLPSCPPEAARYEHTLDLLSDFAGRVVERVPVFHLACLPDADAARLCHNTVFA